MNPGIIGALIQKDLALAMRNRFFAVVLVLGLVAYIAIYLFMPSQVDEDIDFGLVTQLPPAIIEQLEAGEGLRVHVFDSDDELETAVRGGEIMGGLSLPDDFIADITSGVPVSVSLYYSSATPEEYRSALSLMLSEIAYTIAGKPLSVEVNTTVLGRDTTGSPIAPRDTLLPLFAVFIILTEMMSLASLLSEEIENTHHQGSYGYIYEYQGFVSGQRHYRHRYGLFSGSGVYGGSRRPWRPDRAGPVNPFTGSGYGGRNRLSGSCRRQGPDERNGLGRAFHAGIFRTGFRCDFPGFHKRLGPSDTFILPGRYSQPGGKLRQQLG